MIIARVTILIQNIGGRLQTRGPIHFEDLDPHRFEDMIRELIYNFRDWQNIEC